MDDIKRIDLVDIELNSGTLFRSWCRHSIGEKDIKANAFGVRVFRDGQAVDLGSGGAVEGYFRNSQGTNIAITSGNYKSGNVAYVVLPQACYNYEGQFSLAIKLINSSEGITGTMRIVDGMVDNTNTGSAVAQVDTVPTYSEFLGIYTDMVEATEDVREFMDKTMASAYAAQTYAVGDYCIHGGKLYRCVTAILEPTNWDAVSSCWVQVSATDELKRIENELNATENIEETVIPYRIAGSGYISAINGGTATSSNFDYTDYVDIGNYAQIFYKRSKSTSDNAASGIALYNEHKQFIAGFYTKAKETAAGYTDELQQISLSEFPAKYARFSVYHDTETYGDFLVKGKTKQNAQIEKNTSDITECKTFAGITGEETVQTAYRMGNSGVDTHPSSGAKYVDIGGGYGIMCIFNPELNTNYRIAAGNNNRLRVYGILDYVDAEELSEMTSRIQYYVNIIIESEVLTEVRFNSGDYKTIFVYLNNTASTGANCTVYKTADRPSYSTVPVESYKIYGSITGTNPDSTKIFTPGTSSRDGVSHIFNPRENTDFTVTALNNDRLRIYGTAEKYNAMGFVWPNDINVNVINESTDLNHATFNSGEYQTIFIYLYTSILPHQENVECSVIERTETDLLGHVNKLYTEIREAEDHITNVEYSYTPLNEFTDAVKYTIDTTSLGVSYGGVKVNGTGLETNKRIRLLSDMGLGGIRVGKGSKLIPNEGYKINVALYSSYVNNADFTMIGYQGPTTAEYEVPLDCFIRVGIGTVNEDVLWTVNSDGLYTLTEAGEAARDEGVSLTLFRGTIKDEIENVKAQIGYNVWDNVILLDENIPANAVDYHAKFAPLVEAGYITRTLLGKVDNDDTLPIYQYVIRNDMAHIDPDYQIVPWDGSNELYKRPKIFLDSGIHGNERSTPWALYDFIYKLCTDINYQQMRNAFDWYFIPLVNPWGFSHSAKLISSGTIDNGMGYTSSTISNYEILDNTATVHQGIRRNADGIDINRDFSSFVTQEAQILRDAVQAITADGRDFVFAIDSHQATNGNYVNAIGAFLSLQYGAADEDNDFIFSKWMQAGAKTGLSMANYCDRPQSQTAFPWDGTNLLTARNFMAGYADYSMCFETSQTCIYYSQTYEWSNRITRALTNTQYHGFLHILTGKWM